MEYQKLDVWCLGHLTYKNLKLLRWLCLQHFSSYLKNTLLPEEDFNPNLLPQLESIEVVVKNDR